MEKWKIDVPVYMIFFNRPDTLQKVFESVREAKPSKLFLACDGPREGNQNDIENVEACKKVVENIDWECEVHRNYSDVNLGCGMRQYTGISWAFEYVDRLIIIEDDCYLSQDFYPFCEELLERYKDDERIYMISAMNHLGKYEKTPYSYFFSGGSCSGWATWKRAWKDMDFEMGFLDDEYSMNCVKDRYPYTKGVAEKGKVRMEELKKKGKMTSWSYQSGMACYLNNRAGIVPRVNLVKNIGLTDEGVHSVNNIKKLPKKTQGVFTLEIYPMEFPLKHPKYIVEDFGYYKEYQRKLFGANKLEKKLMRLEGIARRIIYADKGEIGKMFKKLFKK